MNDIRTTSEGAARVMTPLPLDFSPNASAELFQKWISSGLLVQTSSALAVKIDKIKQQIEDIFGFINSISARGQSLCGDEIAAVVALANRLSRLVKDLEQLALDGLSTSAILREILQILVDIEDAMNALNQCLKAADGGGTPPANQPN